MIRCRTPLLSVLVATEITQSFRVNRFTFWLSVEAFRMCHDADVLQMTDFLVLHVLPYRVSSTIGPTRH
jgi:hypothetical protein